MWFFNIGIFLWGICGVKRGVVGVKNALAVGLYRGEKTRLFHLTLVLFSNCLNT